MALSPLAISLMMQPPPAQARPGTIAPTDTLGAFNLTANMAEQQYQAKLQQQNALWGGLAAMGGAGITASPKLFGTGGPFASGGAFAPSTAASSAPGAPLSLTPPSLAAPASNALDSTMLNYGAPTSVADWSTPSLDYSALQGYLTPSAADAAGSAGADAAGSVAGDIAADTGAGVAGAAADAGAGMSLADLIPLMFA